VGSLEHGNMHYAALIDLSDKDNSWRVWRLSVLTGRKC